MEIPRPYPALLNHELGGRVLGIYVVWYVLPRELLGSGSLQGPNKR